MFNCPNCNNRLNVRDNFCANCGANNLQHASGSERETIGQAAPPQNVPILGNNIGNNIIDAPPKPDNQLVLSVISLVGGMMCCQFCLPFGIIALIFSFQLDSSYAMGNYDDAERKANTIKTLNYISLGIMAFMILGYALFFILYIGVFAAAGISSSY